MNPYPTPPSWPPTPPPPGPPIFAPAPPSPPSRRALVIALGALAGIAVVIAVLLVVAGHLNGPVGSNGESQKTSHDMLGDAALAFSKAASVHMTGNASNGTETDVYDVHIGTAGAEGTITANGATVHLIAIDTDLYMRGREFFSKFGGADAGAVIADRWVHLKSDDPTVSSYLPFLTLGKLQGVISQLALQAAPAKDGSTHLDGALVMKLRASDGEMDIALDGKPYPRRLSFKDSDRQADLHFADYDAAMSPPQRPADVLEVPGPPSV